MSQILHTPKANALLSRLPDPEYHRLLGDLELVHLTRGRHVYELESPMTHAYFPTSSIMSFSKVLTDGFSMGIALTGNEGLVGVPLLTGAQYSSGRAIVQVHGFAYRIEGGALTSAFDNTRALRHILLRYAQTLLEQAEQTAVCRRHHTVEQQLCLWILSMLDRLACRELEITQEALAVNLGVRREAITQAVQRLQQSGMISCRRGHIAVTDCERMEEHVCECYAVLQRVYRPTRRAGFAPVINANRAVRIGSR